jgi:multidrug efflux pump subunit AcrB
MMDRYMGVLRWSLDTSRAAAYRAAHPRAGCARLRDHRLWMMGLGLLALVMTGAMFVLIPSQFFPDTDSDFSTINVEMVPGTTIDQTAAKTDESMPSSTAARSRRSPSTDQGRQRRVIITCARTARAPACNSSAH